MAPVRSHATPAFFSSNEPGASDRCPAVALYGVCVQASDCAFVMYAQGSIQPPVGRCNVAYPTTAVASGSWPASVGTLPPLLARLA